MVVQPLVLGMVQTHNKKIVLGWQSRLLIHITIITEVCQKSLIGITTRLLHAQL